MSTAPTLIIADLLSKADLPAVAATPGIDVVHIVTESFGIDDARKLKYEATQSAVSDSVRTFVVAARTITVEAQNALLKLFEEPPLSAQFYVVMPHERVLIPTLRSRFVVVTAGVISVDDCATEFLNATLAERLSLIAEKNKVKDYQWMEHIVRTLPATVSADARESVLLVDAYLQTRGAARKMLLEELALALPVKR